MTRFLPTVAVLGASALSVTLFTAPAMADTLVTQTVKLSYDHSKLESATNAGEVLSELESQAREACTSIAPIFRTVSIDQKCVADVVAQAVETIDKTALTVAYEQSPTYQTVKLELDTGVAN